MDAIPLTGNQYDIVRNSLSFALAAMAAATLFFWLGRSLVSRSYQLAVIIVMFHEPTRSRLQLPAAEFMTTKSPPCGGLLHELVAHRGFEPLVSSLRGRCPRPLDECASRSCKRG